MSHDSDAAKPIEILGKTYPDQLADGEYDVVFFSTGLKECILAGLLAVRGWKVLQLDRNAYYGGACASLNLEELYAHYKVPYDAKKAEQQFGQPRRFCVDLVPKFLMANGDVVRMLIQTGVTRYIDFQGISGSYVVASSMFSSKGSIYRVPVTPTEALKSSLVGALQKRSLMNFATWLDKNYQPRDRRGDEAVMGWTEEEFTAHVKRYCELHGETSIPSSGSRLAVAQQLETKYLLPLAPVDIDVTFQQGPLGLRIEAKPLAGTKSQAVKSATRIVGFQPQADGKPGQAELAGKLKEGDLISKIAGQSVLGLADAEVTKRLVESARPVVVSFLRLPPTYANTDPTTSDLRKTTMGQLYAHFGLDDNSQTFIGHAMALETSDAYISQPAEKTVEAVHLYGRSVGRYGQNSPYLYPLYGLSTLPEGFSRLAAIYGGTVMLRSAEHEILVDDKSNKVVGVRVGDKAAKCRFVIGDASYFAPEKSQLVKRVARSICLLKHPIKDTTDGDSAQIILPAKILKNKKHDIYISCVGKTHEVVSQPGTYLAICSTVAETNDPFGVELLPAFEFLGQIEQRFDSVTEVRGPNAASQAADEAAGLVVCEGLDETSHFESAAADIARVYRKVFGKPLDLTEKLVPDQAE